MPDKIRENSTNSFAVDRMDTYTYIIHVYIHVYILRSA